ncbi:MAG: molybdate ABC transporter permease subunit [Desulfarculus sp.]|nr:molybdate ABC transporter permease subunit [Desulfarculus sp.]
MDEVLFPLRLSLQVSLVATLLLTALTLPLALVFARRRFPGRGLLEVVFSLPLVLPPTVLGYYLVVVFGQRGILGGWLQQALGWTPMFNWWGAVLASMVVAFPLLFHSALAALSTVDRNLEQAAYTLGASPWRTFWRVTLPLAQRGIMAGVVLAFARALGEFGATLMIAGNIPGRTNTMPLAIYGAFMGGDLTQAHWLVLIQTLIALLVLLVARRGQGRSWR